MTQRVPQAQTSGSKHPSFYPPSSQPPSDADRTVFKLPAELLLELLSYFDDHGRAIRENCGGGLLVQTPLSRAQVERSTVIRRLTMTCWVLRNALLPELWRNVEGCMVFSYPRPGHTYGLYNQCVYLLANPAIAAYVRCV